MTNIFLAYKKPFFVACGILLAVLCYFWYPSSQPPSEDPKVVEVETVCKKDISQTTTLIGTLRPKQTTILIAKTNGFLDILVQPGEKVKKGALIAQIVNPDIDRTYELAESSAAIAKTQYERATTLEKTGTYSAQGLEEKKDKWLTTQSDLAKVKIERDRLRFEAPFDGVVGVYKVREGTQVRDADPIVSFYDPSSILVEFDIPAPLMTYVHDGQSLRINDKTYALTHVQRMIDEESHMCPAYQTISCDSCIIGTSVDVELVIQSKTDVIVVPFEAVFLRNGNPFVYLVKDGKAALTPVELGIREKDAQEITSGLNKGDVLIVRGQGRLHPEIAVKIHAPKKTEAKK